MFGHKWCRRVTWNVGPHMCPDIFLDVCLDMCTLHLCLDLRLICVLTCVLLCVFMWFLVFEPISVLKHVSKHISVSRHVNMTREAWDNKRILRQEHRQRSFGYWGVTSLKVRKDAFSFHERCEVHHSLKVIARACPQHQQTHIHIYIYIYIYWFGFRFGPYKVTIFLNDVEFGQVWNA